MTLRNVAVVGLAVVVLWGGWSRPRAQGGTPSSVTKEQFERWMTELSNWGRWGDDDERGALHLITPEKVREAAALVRTGETVSLSQQLRRRAAEAVPGPRPVNTGGALTNVFRKQGGALFERQEIEYHGGAISHFDALCHVSYEGQIYNGYDFDEVVTDEGCSRSSVLTAQGGIVTRGLLLDLPETRVTPEVMAAWEAQTGLTVSSGDVLLLRTQREGSGLAGFMTHGYGPSLIPFLKERDVAMIGADIPQEGGAIEGVFIPIHTWTLVSAGMNLLDNLDLHAVAETAARLNRYEFMLVVEPLKVENGAGSAVNAVAIF